MIDFFITSNFNLKHNMHIGSFLNATENFSRFWVTINLLLLWLHVSWLSLTYHPVSLFLNIEKLTIYSSSYEGITDSLLAETERGNQIILSRVTTIQVSWMVFSFKVAQHLNFSIDVFIHDNQVAIPIALLLPSTRLILNIRLLFTF